MRRRWRERAIATVLALGIQAALLGPIFFGQWQKPLPPERITELVILRFPIAERDPPPPEVAEPPPPPRPTPLTPRSPLPTPTPLPAAPPLPVAAQGRGATQGEGPRVIVEAAPAPKALNLGCSGRSYDHMTAAERQRCQGEYARIPGIGDGRSVAAKAGPPVDPSTLATWNAAADQRYSRRSVEGGVAPGNPSSIGCAHGNLGGCGAEESLIPMMKRKF